MSHRPVDRLTPREEEVLAYVAEGKTNTEIADLLGISLDGVKFHVSQILSRLGVESREEAADYWRVQRGGVPRVRRFLSALGGSRLLRIATAATTAAAVSLLLVFVLQNDEDSPGEEPPRAEAGLGKLAYAVLDEPGRGVYVEEVDGSFRANRLDGVAFPGGWREPVAFAVDGSRVAIASDDDSSPAIIVVATDDVPRATVYPVPARPSAFAWSPAGDRIAFAAAAPGEDSDIYALSLADGAVASLTANQYPDYNPAWSPDGAMIAFTSCRDCGAFFDVWVMGADGSGQRNLTPVPDDRGVPVWSPDSSRVAFWSHDPVRSGAYVSDVATGTVRFAGPAIQGGALAWLPDSEALVTVAVSPTEGRYLAQLLVATGDTRSLAASSGAALSGSLVVSPAGDFVAMSAQSGVDVFEVATGQRRFLLMPYPPQHLAWLPSQPTAGVGIDTMPTPLTDPQFVGQLPNLSAADLEPDGWPVLKCPADSTLFHAQTRRLSACVAASLVPGYAGEATRDGDWGWSGSWMADPELGYREELHLRLMEREHSGPRSGWFTKCSLPVQGSILGVPAYICASRAGEPDYLGPGVAGWLWIVSAFAETPGYYLVVNAYGTQEGADAETAIARTLAMLDSARIGDPARVIP